MTTTTPLVTVTLPKSSLQLSEQEQRDLLLKITDTRHYRLTPKAIPPDPPAQGAEEVFGPIFGNALAQIVNHSLLRYLWKQLLVANFFKTRLAILISGTAEGTALLLKRPIGSTFPDLATLHRLDGHERVRKKWGGV